MATPEDDLWPRPELGKTFFVPHKSKKVKKRVINVAELPLVDANYHLSFVERPDYLPKNTAHNPFHFVLYHPLMKNEVKRLDDSLSIGYTPISTYFIKGSTSKQGIPKWMLALNAFFIAFNTELERQIYPRLVADEYTLGNKGIATYIPLDSLLKKEDNDFIKALISLLKKQRHAIQTEFMNVFFRKLSNDIYHSQISNDFATRFPEIIVFENLLHYQSFLEQQLYESGTDQELIAEQHFICSSLVCSDNQLNTHNYHYRVQRKIIEAIESLSGFTKSLATNIGQVLQLDRNEYEGGYHTSIYFKLVYFFQHMHQVKDALLILNHADKSSEFNKLFGDQINPLASSFRHFLDLMLERLIPSIIAEYGLYGGTSLINIVIKGNTFDRHHQHLFMRKIASLLQDEVDPSHRLSLDDAELLCQAMLAKVREPKAFNLEVFLKQSKPPRTGDGPLAKTPPLTLFSQQASPQSKDMLAPQLKSIYTFMKQRFMDCILEYMKGEDWLSLKYYTRSNKRDALVQSILFVFETSPCLKTEPFNGSYALMAAVKTLILHQKKLKWIALPSSLLTKCDGFMKSLEEEQFIDKSCAARLENSLLEELVAKYNETMLATASAYSPINIQDLLHNTPSSETAYKP